MPPQPVSWGRGPFNLGVPDDYRVPDGGYHRTAPGSTFVATAALVVEVVSPDDETFAKFDFYAAHGVEELVVADPQARRVRCWQQAPGGYEERDRSDVLGVVMATVESGIRWPA